jgi:hypothetical protein
MKTRGPEFADDIAELCAGRMDLLNQLPRAPVYADKGSGAVAHFQDAFVFEF